MRTIIHQTEDIDDAVTILLLHGSTQPYFDKFHPLVQFFSKYPFNVVSVELPGHGKTPFKNKIDVNELIETFIMEMRELVKEWTFIGLFGYSLGGSLAFKAVERAVTKPEFIIACGTGFVLGEEETSLIHMFFSDSFFESLGWKREMLRIHENWNALIESISTWYYPESPLLPRVDDIKQSRVPMLALLGDQDEPFPYSKNAHLAADIPHVVVRQIDDCNHFDYFAKAWPQVNAEIAKFLQNLGYVPKKGRT